MLPPTAAERPDYEATIVEIRSKIGDAAFETAFAKGLVMQAKAALEFVLDTVEK